MSNISFKDYLNEQLKDPEIKNEFNKETTKLESAIAVTNVRKAAGLFQRQLATVANLPQSAIAIKNGDNTSMDTLIKIANALDKKLMVLFS
ncbi:helix-turn-helix domain-containing protein [Limosilactobacillus sp.]|uniref:helix-turn-helix domain-containing protein n=1 Tax=Limosilactobacillus sp. TaxID=2773925 RepID=UPI0035A12206